MDNPEVCFPSNGYTLEELLPLCSGKEDWQSKIVFLQKKWNDLTKKEKRRRYCINKKADKARNMIVFSKLPEDIRLKLSSLPKCCSECATFFYRCGLGSDHGVNTHARLFSGDRICSCYL